MDRGTRWLLVAALLLLGATVWLLSRRAGSGIGSGPGGGTTEGGSGYELPRKWPSGNVDRLQMARDRTAASMPYIVARGNCGNHNLKALTWSVDGKYLLAATTGGFQVQEIRGNDLVVSKTQRGKDEPYSIAADAKGKWVAVGMHQGTILTEKERPTAPRYIDIFAVGSWERVIRLDEPDHDVLQVLFTPDGEHLVAATEDQSVHVWHTGDWRYVACYPKLGTLFRGTCIHLIPSGGMLVQSDGPFTLRYRTSWEGDWDWVLPSQSRRVYNAIAFLASQPRRILATVVDSSYPLQRGGFHYGASIEKRRFQEPFSPEFDQRSNLLAWVPHLASGFIAVGLQDEVFATIDAQSGNPGLVHIWRASDIEPIAHLQGSPSASAGLSFHPDGRLMASGWGGGTIVIWDIEKLVRDARGGHLAPILKEDDRLYEEASRMPAERK